MPRVGNCDGGISHNRGSSNESGRRRTACDFLSIRRTAYYLLSLRRTICKLLSIRRPVYYLTFSRRRKNAEAPRSSRATDDGSGMTK